MTIVEKRVKWRMIMIMMIMMTTWFNFTTSISLKIHRHGSHFYRKKFSHNHLIIIFSYYSDRGSCVKCYLSCDTCSGPRRDQCVKCPPGWKLAAGECHPECPEGFFKTEFGCKKCHHYCKTCNGNCFIFYCRSSFINVSFINSCRSFSMHILSESFYAGRLALHWMPQHAVLWSTNASL